jgi:hypothetical protein
MDPREYRTQVERELSQTQESAEEAASPADLASLLGVARDRAQAPDVRANALARASRAGVGDDGVLTLSLDLLASADEPVIVRRAAFDALQLAAFVAGSFDAYRTRFLATLRSIVDDPDPVLRVRALSVLARERDAEIQRRLVDGLQNPQRALVAPEIAIPLLAYDLEAAATSAVRRYAEADAPLPARVEAVRLLATDADARPAVEEIARNRAEPDALRRAATAALHANDPGAGRRLARELVLATDESAEVVATGLVALTLPVGVQEESAEEAFGGTALRDRVEELARTTPSADLRKSAQAFLSRRP